MDVEERVRLVLREPTEEVVTEEELRELFKVNDRPNHYIGFEIDEIYVHSSINKLAQEEPPTLACAKNFSQASAPWFIPNSLAS